jgi:predicted nucleic acid-binding protein
MSRLVLDTCILIDYLRGHPAAAEFIETLDEAPVVSAVTVAELFAGVRDGDERLALDSLASACRIFPVDAATARDGGLLFRQYRRSHGTDLLDAIIAATALAEDLPLATLNRKHFPMLEKLVVPYA